MSTVKQVMIKNLVNHGMFPEQAEKVMETAFEDMPTMKENWNKSADGYPKVVMNVTWMGVKQAAVKWTKENAPEAWFLTMLEG